MQVRLPARDWNGKLYMAGCGGFCGRLDSDLPGFTNGRVATAATNNSRALWRNT